MLTCDRFDHLLSLYVVLATRDNLSLALPSFFLLQMASIQCLNPKAELARHAAALELNISGARGLQEVMRSNLGPKGTLKMYVSLPYAFTLPSHHL